MAKKKLPRCETTLNPFPIDGPLDIPVPKRLETELRRLWILLHQDGSHRYVGPSTIAWEKDNRQLAESVRSGGKDADDDFIDLVRRDRRYLGTKFGQAKMLEWLLLSFWGQRNDGTKFDRPEKGRSKKPDKRIKNAESRIKELGAAVAYVGGKPWLRRHTIHSVALDVRDQVDSAMAEIKRAIEYTTPRSKKTKLKPPAKRAGLIDTAAVAKNTGLGVDVVEYLVKRCPRGTEHAIASECAKKFSMDGNPSGKAERMRKLIKDAERHAPYD